MSRTRKDTVWYAPCTIRTAMMRCQLYGGPFDGEFLPLIPNETEWHYIWHEDRTPHPFPELYRSVVRFHHKGCSGVVLLYCPQEIFEL